MTQVETAEAGQGFAHPALFYQGPWEYLAGTVPFILEGLSADIPVAVAAPDPRLQLLRDALGADADRVQLLDMAVAGRNPGRIIAEVLLALRASGPTGAFGSSVNRSGPNDQRPSTRRACSTRP